MDDFAIYPLEALGGMLALSPMPGRTRHYGADRDRLLAWRPDIVLSMCELPELARKGSAGLGEDVAAQGGTWLHVPVADFGVPASDAGAWAAISDQVRETLAAGGRVLIHCFGGCGRSGMAALRILVDSGMEPGAALVSLRRARPCAVETDAQMSWATGGQLTSARP